MNVYALRIVGTQDYVGRIGRQPYWKVSKTPKIYASAAHATQWKNNILHKMKWFIEGWEQNNKLFEQKKRESPQYADIYNPGTKPVTPNIEIVEFELKEVGLYQRRIITLEEQRQRRKQKKEEKLNEALKREF